MKIVFQAFHWKSTCPAIPLSVFLPRLLSTEGITFRRRKFYFIDNNDKIVGLVLTIKDMKKFVTLMQSAQGAKLDVHALSANENIADFNFFIIHKKSGFGLYQYYHNSCSLNIFNHIVKSFFAIIRKKVYEINEKQMEAANLKKKIIDAELKKYRGRLDTSIVERKGTFLERVKTMRDANAATLEFSELSFSNSPFQAIQPHIKSMKYRMAFLKETSKIDKIRNLATLVRDSNLEKCTVEGIDEYGNDVIYKLFNDFDRFKEFDYDDMVPSLDLDKTKIANSILSNKIISELNSVFDEIYPGFPQ